DIGVSEDAIPDVAKAPSGLLEALEAHCKSLERGQIPAASKTTHLNLAPITISLKSEQFNFKEEELAEQFSPDENSNEAIDSQPTLLQSAQTTNPGGEGPWQSLFEPAEIPQANKTTEPSNNQNDLLELHAVFQTQQAPATNAFPPSPNFGIPGYNPGMSQPVIQTSNPFEIHSELQSSSNILQPMNKPEQTVQQVPEQPARQSSTGDLHSSLSKVAKSLDNFDLTSACLGSGSSGHQWTAPKPKVKTGGANFQIGTIAGSTLPPVSPTLPYNAPPQPTMPPTGLGMGQPRPVLTPGYTQPQMLGPRPMAYGQQPMMRPQTTMYAAPRANVNPFGNPVPRNQALF
ncbi:Hypothetical predicted protein, partial [Paramuricea clavata]